MKLIKRLSVGVLALALALSLTACGGGKATVTDVGYSGIAANDYQSDSYSYGESYDGGFDAPEAMAVSETGTVSSNRKLITTVNVTAETKDYDAAVNDLLQKVSYYGGYAENSDVYSHNNSSRHCSFTLRIPENSTSEFLGYLDEALNVTWKSTQDRDVTLDYVDAESYKSALIVERDRLLELLDQADNLEEILQIEDRLTSVRYQLESYERTLRTYDDQIEYTTISLSIDEVVELTEPEPEGWFERAGKGIVDNFNAVVTFFQELGLAIVINLPALTVFALFVIIIVIVLLRVTRKSRARAKQVREMVQAQQRQQMVQPVMPEQSGEVTHGDE